MGYEYGRKVHASIDTDSLSIMQKSNFCLAISIPIYIIHSSGSVLLPIPAAVLPIISAMSTIYSISTLEYEKGKYILFKVD